MTHKQPHTELLTLHMRRTIVLALASSLESWADECSRTIADGKNMEIARILAEDDYYIQLKEIHASL